MRSTAPTDSACVDTIMSAQPTAAAASAISISRASSRSRIMFSIRRVYRSPCNSGHKRFCFFPGLLRILPCHHLVPRGIRVSTLKSSVNPKSPQFEKSAHQMVELLTSLKNEEEKIREGGGAKAIESQHKKNRLTARERITGLIDPGTHFFELGIYAAYEMYEEWGGAPAAGTITGLGRVPGRLFMIIANDATVKAGAFFPMTAKKVIRAQNISIDNHIPTIYLVDSAGVFLPLQEDVFPDTDDFGRVFRNNAVMSAMGIPQITAIMGMCVAGGAYLPLMCDHILMTEGSGLFLAGPALVQAAIGQKVSAEELGGATMHSAISGTVDFREPNDEACLQRIRALVDKMGHPPFARFNYKDPENPLFPPEE